MNGPLVLGFRAEICFLVSVVELRIVVGNLKHFLSNNWCYFTVHNGLGNVQMSYDTWGGDLLKPSEYRLVEGGGWPNRHITLYSG